jgi:predicted RNase H-like nuclease
MTPISIETFKQAVTEVTEKDNEMQMRDRGVVIYRIPENHAAVSEQRKKDYADFVHELLHYMGLDEATPAITHLERLGRYDEDKCKEGKYQTVKLRFTIKDVRDKVLKNLGRLRHATKMEGMGTRTKVHEEQQDKVADVICITATLPKRETY